jgi:bidirectional [NiFe] hydrogenase diaphorase subunit
VGGSLFGAKSSKNLPGHIRMKNAKPVLPSQDKRWKIVDAKMRRYGYQANALIETLHIVQQSFGYLDE